MKCLVSSNGSVVKVVKAIKETVEALLSGNVNNRPLSQARVSVLVKELESGRWKFNGSTIVVDEDGKLLDGQHRLAAIRNAGYPEVDLIVVTLASDKSTMNTIDTGKSRSCSDIFKMNNISNYSWCSSVTNSIIRYFTNYKGNGVIPRTVAVDYYNSHSEIINKFVSLYARGSVKFMINCSAMASFVATAMAMPSHTEEILNLVLKISEADGLIKGTPEYALHKYLINYKAGVHLTGSKTSRFVSGVASGVIQHINHESCSFIRADSSINEKIAKLINKGDN